MKRIFAVFAITVAILFSANGLVSAQTSAPVASSEPIEITEPSSPETQLPPQDEYSQAKVTEIQEDQNSTSNGVDQPFQKVKLQITSGNEKGKEIVVGHGDLFSISEDQKVKVGETVVVTKTVGPQGELYYITDKYRIQPLLILFGIFIVLVLLLGRLKGISSIVGLGLSILVLLKYVLPQILLGANPLTTSLIGALVIAVVSLYMAHGFNKRTTIALASTIFTLCIAAVLSILYVNFVNLSGTGSEEAVFLRMGPIGNIDLKGLLLGGIIIGALGVLDDITISQSASVDELKKANPNLTRNELFKRGMSIGKEHVASLVNTLALAYVGASFPLMLLFSLGQSVPFWLTLNSEFIIEELVRTLVGSTALVIAVPISTFLAAYFLGKQPASEMALEIIGDKKVVKRATTRKKSTKTVAKKTTTRKTARRKTS